VLADIKRSSLVRTAEVPTLEESMIKLEAAIPCLMHCLNGTGKKFLFHLLLDGMSGTSG